jgi:hypothetical protein
MSGRRSAHLPPWLGWIRTRPTSPSPQGTEPATWHSCEPPPLAALSGTRCGKHSVPSPPHRRRANRTQLAEWCGWGRSGRPGPRAARRRCPAWEAVAPPPAAHRQAPPPARPRREHHRPACSVGQGGSVTGSNGSFSASGRHPPPTATIPPTEARARASATNRVLATPASPTTSTSRARSASADCSRDNSPSRQTKAPVPAIRPPPSPRLVRQHKSEKGSARRGGQDSAGQVRADERATRGRRVC